MLVSPLNKSQRFGRLTILKKDISKQNHAYYLCLCDCGKEKVIRSSYLRQGITKSCGCQQYYTIKTSYGNGKINKLYFNQIKNRARKKNWKFHLTTSYLQKLYNSQNGRCALSGEGIFFSQKSNLEQTASLDRIDNKKGYIKGNVQWLHKDVNQMKWQFPTDRLLELCKKITKNKRKD